MDQRQQAYVGEYMNSIEAAGDSSRGQQPTPPEVPTAKMTMEAQKEVKKFPAVASAWPARAEHYTAVHDRTKTIDPAISAAAFTRLVLDGQTSTQAPKALKGHAVAPKPSTITKIRCEYQAVLEKAAEQSVNPRGWLNEWFLIFSKAQVYSIPEVQGNVAVSNFLMAVQANVAPYWARQEFYRLIENEVLGRPQVTLEVLGKVLFAVLEHELHGANKGPGRLTTKGGKSPNAQKGNPCPCLPGPGIKHPWRPDECGTLEFSLRGSTRRRIKKPSKEQCEDIKLRYGMTRWDALREHLTEKYNLGKDKGNEGKNAYLERHMTSFVIDPTNLDTPTDAGGICNTMFACHPLSTSTLLHNCSDIHLVNDKDLLVSGTFRPAKDGESVDAGTTSYPILGKGDRLMPKTLNTRDGPGTGDLLLKNVAVVEGLHVNVVSEARLREAGVWHCGLDRTLRRGGTESSCILKKLTAAHSLLFFEYKPTTSLCSSSALMVGNMSSAPGIPTGAAGVIC